MPIEIRELIIRTNIVDEPGTLNSRGKRLDNETWDQLKSEIIEICDRRIKDVLRKRDGR
jgi:hypothetical protein